MAQRKHAQIVLGGENTDQSQLLIGDKWRLASDCEFRTGVARTIGADALAFTTSVVSGILPRYLLNAIAVPSDSSNYWLYGGAGGIAVTDEATHKTITPSTFTTPLADDAWTGGILNGIPFLNYGTDVGCSWGRDFTTPTVMAPLTDAPECGALRPYKNQFVAMDCSGSGHATIPSEQTTVAWSDAADPGTLPNDWTPSTNDLAGFVELGADGGRCIDGVQYRDSFLIGKDNSFWVMDFVGGNEIMTFRRLMNTSGLPGKNCMVEVDGLVYMVTDTDVVVTDGSSVKSICKNVIRDLIFSHPGDNTANAWIAYDRTAREVIVSMPNGTETESDRLYVYTPDHDMWCHRTAPTSQAVDSAYGVSGVNTDYNQHVFINAIPHNTASLIQTDVPANGNKTPFLQTGRIDLGRPDIVKTVVRVWPLVEGLPAGKTLTVSVDGYSSLTGGQISDGGTETYTQGTDDFITTTCTGRYVSFEVTTGSLPGNDVKIPGFIVEYEEAQGF
jgi:uncharacterized protein (DUF433 family)